MGAKSRNKGAAFEREVVALAREHGFAGALRAAPLQAGGYADQFADVIGTGRLRIECKRRASGSLAAGRPHVEAEEVPGFVNVAACRDDHGEPLAVLRLVDLLKLERQALGKAPASPATGCREGCRCEEPGGGVWAAMEHAGTPPPLRAGKTEGEPA